jgi:hypothetical protein
MQVTSALRDIAPAFCSAIFQFFVDHCPWWNVPPRIGFLILNTAAPLLAIERLLATRFYYIYESSRRIVVLGAILCGVHVTVSHSS